MRLINGLGKKVVSSSLSALVLSSFLFSGLIQANETQAASQVVAPQLVASELPQESLTGILSTPLTSDQSVINYVTSNKSLFGLSDPSEQLMLMNKTFDATGQSHYLYQLQHNGIPVYGKYMRVHLNAGKRISEIRNQMTSVPLPLMPLTTKPSLSVEEAILALKADLEKEIGRSIQLDTMLDDSISSPASSASLIIYPYKGKSYLAYETNLNFLQPTPGNWVAYIDAQSGQIIDKYNKIAHIQTAASIEGVGHSSASRVLNVTFDDLDDASVTNDVYRLDDRSKNMYNEELDTGKILTFNFNDIIVDKNSPPVTVPVDASASLDEDVVDAHFYSGVVYDYFKNNFNRNSIDNLGMDMVSVVHYLGVDLLPYDNAFWNGSFMVYGDGKGVSNGGFDCFTCALDVVGHEITHGITERTANLEYRHQSGALNESFSDIFGALIEMDYENSEDWTIAEDSNKTLRDMVDPTLYKQPAHMNNFKYLSRDSDGDYGGVHINSGIQNHAAYLIATGIDSLNLNGIDGKEVLQDLSYDVLVNRMMPTSDFEDARDAYVASAESLYASNSAIAVKVKEAWAAVGLPYGQNYDITSIEVPNGTAWIDQNSNEIYINVPNGTDLTTINPLITVSAGAVLNSVDVDFSDYIGEYEVSSQGTTVTWIVIIDSEMPSLQYTMAYPTDAFFETNQDNGVVTNDIIIDYNYNFTGTPGEDFLETGKIVISPIPEGLVAHTLLVNNNRLRVWFMGQAENHTNRDDIDNLSIRFQNSAFVGGNEYQVANYFKQNMSIDFKHSLHIASKTDTSAILEWPSPSNATQIQIMQSTDEGITWTSAVTAAPVLANSTSANVTNLTPSTLYRFKLVITGGEDAGESVDAIVNEAPTVASPIADKSATVGTADVTVALTGVFTDLNAGDILVYSVTSSATSVATVSVTGNTLTVHPVAAGTANITVTANDGHGHTVNDVFAVSVSAAVSNGGNGGGGGGGGGFGGGFTIPAEPEVKKDTDGSVSLGDKAMESKQGTSADGTPYMEYTVNGDSLKEAVDLLKDSEDQTIHLKLGESKQSIEVKLPIAVFTDVQKNSNTLLSVETDGASYMLPLQVLDINNLAREMGVTAEQLQLSIILEPLTGTAESKVKESAEQAGLKVIGAPIEFTVKVTGGNKTVELYDFNRTYVSRTITLTTAVSNGNVSAVLYDPATGEMTFVPAVFEIIDGKTVVTIQRNGNSIYTIVENKKSFDDIPAGFWAKEDIELLASKLVIKGVSDKTFKPNGEITRAEFASLLVRALGLTPDKAAANFSDIKQTDWFAGSIGAAVKADLVKGFNDGTFHPQSTITREQMAVMVQNALNYVGKGKSLSMDEQAKILSTFDDRDSISSYALTAAAGLIDAGIIIGYTADQFAPDIVVTRAQAAVILKRMLQHVKFIN